LPIEHKPIPPTDKEILVKELLDARKSILTKAFVDEEFANSTGFGYEDDLKEMKFETNTLVRYTLVPLENSGEKITSADISANTSVELAANKSIKGTYSLSVKYGVEEPVETPQDFTGYGADNEVSLRWMAPQTEYAKGIISGYYVERRKKSETTFSRVTDVPIAISYTQEGNQILYETAAFYMDKDVRNGDELVYRIQALDIFGRLSDFSSELDIKVYKVTPPQQPILDEPSLSIRSSRFNLRASTHLFQLNPGNSGVALPITHTSDDTSLFVVYRSKVYGNGPFGIPQELVRINIAPFMEMTQPLYSLNTTNAIFIINPPTETQVDVLYYDNTAQPGFYYKYWVAAVDSWGNESAWSDSKVVGFSSNTPPQDPVNPVVIMRHNQFVEGRPGYAPGFFNRYLREATDSWGILDDLKSFFPSIQGSGITGIQGALSNGAASTLSDSGSMTGVSPRSNQNRGNTVSLNQAAVTTASQSSSTRGMVMNGQSVQILDISAMTPVTGFSFSEAIRKDFQLAPSQLSMELDNLPDSDDIHELVALSNEDVLEDGSVLLNWYHYSGEGLLGYAVYRAYADGISREALSNMTKEEILEAFSWSLRTNNTDVNQLADTVIKKDGRFYLYMVCLAPSTPLKDMLESTNNYIKAGWVRLTWERPEDSQVSYFKVYRAEVPGFTDADDTSGLAWTLVSDKLRNTVYSEKVDQTYAHYYYYKITSVSIWGVESENGSITNYRVPSTVAPQAPTLLVPFSRKATNQVNWLGVTHASKYVIYRKILPKITVKDISLIKQLSPEFFSKMYNLDMHKETYAKISEGARAPQEPVFFAAVGGIPNMTPNTSHQMQSENSVSLTGKFKTIQNMERNTFHSNISGISLKEKLSVFNSIVKKYGILAVAPYSSLNEKLASAIEWEKAGEVIVTQGQDPTGKKSFSDTDVVFGETYLYTVQAVNDDKLSSDRPEPVSVFTRKGEAFPPVTNLRWEAKSNMPLISWEPAKDPNMTVEESQKFLKNIGSLGSYAGYLVYRSNTRYGEYHQVSTLIPCTATSFWDIHNSIHNENWYKVKVVDTAGYISDFSEQIYATRDPLEYPESGFQVVSSNFDENSPVKTVAASVRYPILIDDSMPVVASRINPTLPAPTPEIIIPKTTPIPPIIIPATPVPTPIPSADNPTHVATPAPSADNPTHVATPTPKPLPTIKPDPGEIQLPTPKPTHGPVIAPPVQFADTLKINNFVIKNVTSAALTTGNGSGNLMVDDYPVPVNIHIVTRVGDKIINGNVTLKNNVTLGGTGIHFTALKVEAGINDAIATGYIKKASGSVMGDLQVLKFTNSRLREYGVLHIYNFPIFYYQNLCFTKGAKISVNFGGGIPNISTNVQTEDILNSSYGKEFITLHMGTAVSNLGFELLINKGLEYNYTSVSFDTLGRLSGTMALNGTQDMMLVIPSGLTIKATDSTLKYSNGQVLSAQSHITGKILTPFKKFVDVPVSGGVHSSSNSGLSFSQEALSALESSNSSSGLSAVNQALLENALYYLTIQSQSDALVIAPDNQNTGEYSYLSFSVQNWDGGGFMVQDTTMTPSNVPLYIAEYLTAEELKEQKDALLGITPIKVALDLRRDAVYPGTSTADTKVPEWMGIVVKGGNVSMPPSYVTNKNNSRIRFNLTPGELLYDQNGFCYQNQAYTPEGVPAKFGTDLGEFDNVLVRNIVLDLYNNKADLVIEADLPLPLLQRRIKVNMLRDDQSNKFVCNVLETDELDLAGDGKVKIQILGGFMDKLGIHLDGVLNVNLGDNGKELRLSDAQFNDLIIPSDMAKMESEEGNGIYGTALFDKPYSVKFNDFPMEIRVLSLYSKIGYSIITGSTSVDTAYYTGNIYTTTMTLGGGMQLSDNLTLNTDKDMDRLVIKGAFSQPEMTYDKCMSVVDINFEEFAEVRGVGKPIVSDGDRIEYDTSENFQMKFTSSKNMNFEDPLFKYNARFGYDKNKARSFFAVAIYYTGPGIPFGFGEITDMGGMMGYNMEMDKKGDGTYNIPQGQSALTAMVDDMSVSTDPGGNYFFAAACTMRLGYDGLSLGEVRDIYLIVEKGPTVEMGGTYYGAGSVQSLVSGGGLQPMGTAKIGYYHRKKLFKFSIDLNANIFGLSSVRGGLGFEMCPNYWELRIGYPDTLIADSNMFQVGFGLAIRDSDIDNSYIKAKAHFGFDTGRVTISIVYVRAFLEVGGEGKFSSGCFMLNVNLRGGVQGGVCAVGQYFEVISLMLEANGELKKYSAGGWTLDASARISYHVDLWLTDIGGSVGWHINTSF